MLRTAPRTAGPDRNYASPIPALTGGVHLHTLSCPSEAVFAHLKETLADMGMLYDAN